MIISNRKTAGQKSAALAVEQTQIQEEKEEEKKYDAYNETIVTLRIPKSYYKTAHADAHLLGFKSFDEYVSHAVIQNVFVEIDGRGSISVDCIETQELLEES